MDDIQCPVAQWAQKAPERVALKTAAGTISFGEWHERIMQLQSALARHGVGCGDRVALILPPEVDCLSLLMALFRLGAVACPVNRAFPPPYRNELLEGLACSLIIGDGTADSDLPAPCLSPSALTAMDSQDADVVDAPLGIDRPAAIILTSGSSGPPKAAVLSIGNLLHNAWLSNDNIALGAGDTWLLSLPLHHVAGLGILFRCVTAGATIGVPEPDESLEAATHRLEATHFSLVARQLARLLDSKAGFAALGRAKAVLLGGSAIPRGLLDRGARAGLTLFTSYGMTEMASQVTTTVPSSDEEGLLTSGRPLAPGAIRIGEGGLVQVNGPTRFLGYCRDGAIEEPFDGDGWFTTGDLGHFDNAGNLHITGRADNMFVAGGENIQPEVIERVLCEIAGVRQAVVVPVPHPEFGAMPVAFLEDTQARGEGAILEILRGQLPSFQVPRHLFPWPEEGSSVGLKVSRAAFAQAAVALLKSE